MIADYQTTCLILNYIGQVQGVGMRPFLYRVAGELHLTGRIYNHKMGVTAELEGPQWSLNAFHKKVLESATKPIVISEYTISWQPPRGHHDLKITTDTQATTATTHSIQADAATCKQCWADFFDSESRFFSYAFVSCCECGPRWSVLHRFPFERSNTSYDSFKFCIDCLREYQNPQSRRHHAQTLSCPVCGPQITMHMSKANSQVPTFENVQKIIRDGGIGLVKGIGGFQLVGNAKNLMAIERIRQLKERPSQSLAIMIRDQDVFLKSGGTLIDWQLLTQPLAPILSIKNFDHIFSKILAPDLNELGVMAATTPFHFKLFSSAVDSIVVTSGNPKGSTLPRSIDEIKFSLDSDIDFIIDHNREIVHAIDDSVLRGDLVLRKARGLTPALHYRGSLDSINPSPKKCRLALGADLKNASALQMNQKIIEFPYLGDLNDQSILQAQTDRIGENLNILGCKINDIEFSAIDFHPETATQNLTGGHHQAVPHHLAHAWSAYSECPSDIVLTFDGTGYDDHFEMGGGDGFILDQKTWQRVLRLKPINWVGGNSSVTEPWKSLVLHFSSAQISVDTLYKCFPDIPKEHIDVFYTYALTSQGLPTTSMGRWFDAAAALIEFGAQKQSYEAQAPIRLEHLAKHFQSNLEIQHFVTQSNRFNSNLIEIDGVALLQKLFYLKFDQKVSQEHLAFVAHDLMAKTVAYACRQLCVKSVTGTGGVFQNLLFASLLKEHLQKFNILFTLPKEVPVNDQCIALGQLYYLESIHA